MPEQPTGAVALTVRSLRKNFGKFVALDGVDLSVRQGERRAVIGPNGAGKTTLINVLGGQLVGDSGSVMLGTRNLMKKYPHQMSRLGIGRTFQISSTFPRMTVFDNMLSAHVCSASWWFSLSAGRLKRIKDEVMSELEIIHLDRMADQVVEDISHGDRKRLEFGMVLATKPSLLLLDEPTAGMGLQERHELIDLVLKEVTRRKLTLVFVEHDIDIVFKAAEHITVMALGKVFAEGKPEEIAKHQGVQEIYLGG
ncbi:MAG: ABC transporter ATP-binding protein [Candidatus Lambdaproteobacteria bacterium]|nr:ABC transporter ATP-binding protein [Candidatus Lambdaproteobacteria bacterium]